MKTITVPIELFIALLNIAKSYMRLANQFKTYRDEYAEVIKEAETLYHATL